MHALAFGTSRSLAESTDRCLLRDRRPQILSAEDRSPQSLAAEDQHLDCLCQRSSTPISGAAGCWGSADAAACSWRPAAAHGCDLLRFIAAERTWEKRWSWTQPAKQTNPGKIIMNIWIINSKPTDRPVKRSAWSWHQEAYQQEKKPEYFGIYEIY